MGRERGEFVWVSVSVSRKRVWMWNRLNGIHRLRSEIDMCEGIIYIYIYIYIGRLDGSRERERESKCQTSNHLFPARNNFAALLKL